MSEVESEALEKAREFGHTFLGKNTGRPLTAQEESTLRAAEKLVREKIPAQTPLVH